MESNVSRDIKSVLSSLQLTGDIIWWSRLQAGKVQVGGCWIHLCEDGTWDFACVFKNKIGNLSFMFIESKRDDKPPKIRDSQERFYDKYGGKHKDMLFTVANNADSLKKYILSLCHNRIQDIDYDP